LLIIVSFVLIDCDILIIRLPIKLAQLSMPCLSVGIIFLKDFF
jgi:hypothetical protein